MKVLIFVGFDDIGCDIRIFELDGWKVVILLGFLVVLVEWLKFNIFIFLVGV